MSDRADAGGRTGRLIDGCIDCVDRCGALLNGMPGEVFASRGDGNSSIGAHVRHIVDRYQCVLNGLAVGCIDYDDRKRGTSVETDVRVAAGALAETRGRFENLDLDACGAEISVRELVHYNGEPTVAASTLDRELMGLITHSIHHLAIIAMIARSASFSGGGGGGGG
ncbi:MAG: DinB family protein, partial [Gammaproteobacteria bacterium]|nr:DinB family protein [Gammaproteobacteria bacterium]